MANEMQWDVQQIQQNGTRLADKAAEMFTTLQQASAVIRETKSSFDSPEGNAMRQQFESLRGDFETFRTDVTTFGEFIRNYGQKGEQLQQETAAQARKLPGSNR